MAQAKRLVFPSKLTVEVETFEIPDDPTPTEVIVENLYGLISPGTELAMFTETHIGFPLPDFTYASFAFRPGYASVGRAVKVGADVNGLEEGDIVFTRSGHSSHTVAGGGRAIQKIPDGMKPEHAPFASLAQIALTAIRVSNPRLGFMAAVFGQGLIGNLAAQLLRAAGARRVIGIDVMQPRLDISSRCGIEAQINPTGPRELSDTLGELTDGSGCHIVVEATGAPSVIPQAIKAARERGKVVLLGSPRGRTEIDPYFDVHVPGVSIIGAHARHMNTTVEYGDPDPTELMLSFIADQKIAVAPLITHTLPATQAPEAYDGLLNHKETYLGVLLDLTKWD
ncbi:MAG: zinc-binding alcohol dehydrogenase [Candidatus Poribacteria bacterium]